MDHDTRTPRWPFAVALLLVLLVAAGLRLYRLPDLPLGLHYDEAANGILAGEIAQGIKAPVFIPSYTGKEVLFFYWAALWMKLLGATPLALRLSAALAGVATVAATVWAVRELLHGAAALPFGLNGRRDAGWVALLTGAFLATSFWHLVLSRYGFRAVTQPLMQALTVAALWRGLRLPPPHSVVQRSPDEAHRPESAGAGWTSDPSPPVPRRRCVTNSLPWLLLAGICCGLTAYTYLAARAFPIPLAAALLALLVADRGHRRARLGQIAFFAAVAALVLSPLAHYWLTHPGSFLNRTRQVAAADWAEAWAGIRACLGMFFLRGDPYIRFNLPHRPLFDPITAALFLLGIIALVKPQTPAHKPQTPNPKPQTSNTEHPASSIQHPASSIQLPASSFQLPASSTQHPVSSTQPPAPYSPCHRVTPSPCLLASCVFLLTYLPTMLLPSALATGETTPSNLRAAGLLPFITLFPALGLSTLISQIPNLKSRISRHLPSSIRPLPSLICHFPFVICHFSLTILLLALLTPLTARAYFGDWARSAALYDAADGDLADVAAYLNRADPAATTPYVASVHYRHPTLAFLAEDYGAIRWLRGGETIVFPAEGDALLVYPRSAPKDLSWVRSVLPGRSLVAAPPGPDGAPAFHAYRVGPDPDLAPAYPLAADLAHVALVLGYDVVGEPRSGERADVAVWWQVLNAPDRGDYAPVARLVDTWGFVWGDKRPFHYPSEQWTPGEWVVDHLSIPVGAGAPPGDYRVQFSLYSASVDATLPVLDDAGRYAGTGVELPLRLARAAAPPEPGELDIRTRLDARAGGLTLLGINLDTRSARPGEPLFLTLFWRADEPPLPDTDVHLALGDATLYASAPVHGTHPTSGWAAGETVADRYGLRLPLDTPPGDHPLRLRLEDPGTGRAVGWSGGPVEGQPLDLGVVSVEATARVFDVPPISHPLTATLGGQVELLGYELATPIPGPSPYEGEGRPTVAPGETLTLTLYWRALAEMDESYTVFTHLLAPDGTLSGQRDNPPVGGTYPTNLWLAGEVVTDVYEIPIRADAPPGAHRLEVGMYLAETGARLPVDGTAADAIFLQTVTVAGP